MYSIEDLLRILREQEEAKRKQIEEQRGLVGQQYGAEERKLGGERTAAEEKLREYYESIGLPASGRELKEYTGLQTTYAEKLGEAGQRRDIELSKLAYPTTSVEEALGISQFGFSMQQAQEQATMERAQFDWQQRQQEIANAIEREKLGMEGRRAGYEAEMGEWQRKQAEREEAEAGEARRYEGLLKQASGLYGVALSQAGGGDPKQNAIASLLFNRRPAGTSQEEWFSIVNQALIETKQATQAEVDAAIQARYKLKKPPSEAKPSPLTKYAGQVGMGVAGLGAFSPAAGAYLGYKAAPYVSKAIAPYVSKIQPYVSKYTAPVAKAYTKAVTKYVPKSIQKSLVKYTPKIVKSMGKAVLKFFSKKRR